MKSKQGFVGGLDQDSAKNKRNSTSYYSLSNFRVVTDKGLSSGSLENEKGNLLSFIIPDISEMILDDSTIPEQTNLTIIGYATMVNSVILFTTNNSEEEPDSYGQIWKFDYDEETNTIIDIDPGNILSISDHLIYNNKLDFSSVHRIKALCRFENEKIGRVYWTDYYNPVRVLNLLDPDTLNIPLDTVDLKPNVDFAQPNILSIGVGNLPAGSVVQFAYRLLDSGGAETLFSPVSVLTNLISNDYNTLIPSDIKGTQPNSTNSKSVTYNIIGLDTNYSYIEHYIVVYLSENDKKIYKFREDPIPSSGELVVTCDSLSEAIEITYVEFNMLYSGFDVAKDIEVKNSRLIAANTKTKTFDLDFDARTYRFDNTSEALLKDLDEADIILTGPTPAYGSVPEDFDAINIYNDESDINWDTLNQYKYQVDGTTLGGSGLNVSYKFVTDELVGNGYSTMLPTPSKHIKGYKNPPGSTKTLGVLESDGTAKIINTENQLLSLASQWGSSNLVSYTRGEIYRFGIVFYNKKGSNSFVKWIGDIKFPEVSDGYPIQDADDSFSTARLYTLGIKFTVDISSIKDQISGYSIVRLERKEEDKTRLGSGMLMHFDFHSSGDFYSLPHRWESTGPNGTPAAANRPYNIQYSFSIPGNDNAFLYHLSDRPGFGPVGTEGVGYLISPIGQIYNNNFKPGDWLQSRAYYKARVLKYSDSGTNNAESEDEREYAFAYKLSQYVTDDVKERVQLHATQILGQGEISTIDDEGILVSPLDIVNAYASRTGAVVAAYNKTPLGIGNRKLVFGIKTTGTTIPNVDAGFTWKGPTSATVSRYTGPNVGATDTIEFDGGDISDQDLYFKEVVYGRYLTNQYRGNDFITRSKDSYIGTNHFQVVNENIASSLEFTVYGGDTYINYYDQEHIEQYWSGDPVVNGALKAPGTNRLGVAVCLPTESTVNTNFRIGRTWAGDRVFDDMGLYQSNEYSIYSIYKQQNTTFEKYFSEDFLFQAIENHPHQLWASDNKIDGELVDSWRSFKSNNKTEVNGIYGPINRIITFKDRLYFYQTKAFGVASIDDQSVIQDNSGQELIIGTGGVFPTYGYISTITGAFHQFAVSASEFGLYHYDSNLKKAYRFNGAQVEALSDSKRMASFFQNEISNRITDKDYTVSTNGEFLGGVHSVYEPKYNSIIFTFLNSIIAKKVEDYLVEDDSYVFEVGDLIDVSGTIYESIVNYIYTFDPETPSLPNFGNTNRFKLANTGRSIIFNEALQAFEEFPDYTPNIYIPLGRKIISTNPEINKGYLHYEGEYGKYYDVYFPSKINVMMSNDSDIIKIYNNLAYKSELFDSAGNDIYNETFDSIRLRNNYQDTDYIDLLYSSNIIPGTIGDIRRRMRTWHYTIPRYENARLRDAWMQVYLSFENNNNKRLVMHEIEVSYTPSPF